MIYWAPLQQPSRVKVKKPISKAPWASPYPSRQSHTPVSPLIITPQASREVDDQPAGLPPKIVYTKPYLTWNPSDQQLWDCHDMLRGEGWYAVELECLHSKDPRHTKNRKWACKWEGCHRILGSQGEARAHGLVHLDVQTGVVCECNKSFSNAKTLGTHLHCFHNILLASVHHPTDSQPIIEDPTHPLHYQ